MSTTASTSKTVTIVDKIGNKPYAYCKVGGDYSCEVDFDSSRPWAVKIKNVDGALKNTNVGGLILTCVM